MTDLTDVGYFSIELGELQLSFSTPLAEDYNICVEVEIQSSSAGDDGVKWDGSGSSVFRSELVKPISTLQQSNLESAGEEGVVIQIQNDDTSTAATSTTTYMIVFNSKLYKRSSYISLKNDTIDLLANTKLNVKCLLIKEPGPIIPEVIVKKGAPPPAPIILEEIVSEMTLPLSSLLNKRGASLEGAFPFDNKLLSERYPDLYLDSIVPKKGAGSDFIGEESSLFYRVAADNDLAECVMGCNIMSWEGVSLVSPPVDWLLLAPDVPDPKAKVQPSAEEFRKRYLANIERILLGQAKIVKYSALVKSGTDTSDNNDNGKILMFPPIQLNNGTILYDMEAAKEVPIDVNIREMRSLWSVSWTDSPRVFLHRSAVRQIVNGLKDPKGSKYVVSLSKNPAEETGSEISSFTLTATLDISPILEHQEDGFAPKRLKLTPFCDTEERDSSSSLAISLCLSTPLLLQKPIIALAPPSRSGKRADRQTSRLTSPDLKGGAKKDFAVQIEEKDVMGELRAEITSVIKLIAQEYVQQYPIAAVTNPPPSPSRKGGPTPTQDTGTDTLSERKNNFLHYLSASGVYHNFKEKLKPKIQRAAREIYGPRGQALGKSKARGMSQEKTSVLDPENRETEGKELDEVLSELYVFLVRESNLVLNTVYTETIIDRDVTEFDSSSVIDDEVASGQQLFKRLLVRALDSEADNRPKPSEQLHLERIQLSLQDPTLSEGSKAAINQHSAYAKYGEFCLRQAAIFSSAASSSTHSSASSSGCKGDSDGEARGLRESSKSYAAKGRELLEIACSLLPSDWRSCLLLACQLVESDQWERAEAFMTGSLHAQLNGPGKGGMLSLNEFDGYDSDRLCPVDPVYFAVLAGYYLLRKETLKCRKALRLVSKSFLEGTGYQPPISTHGTPRRTVVIVLAQACSLLFEFGCCNLGKECLALANMSDLAVTKKTAVRGLRADTLPFVRHLLHKVNSEALLSGSPTTELTVDPKHDQDSDGENKPPSNGGQLEGREGAVGRARDSVHAADEVSDQIQGWLCLANALTATKADVTDIIEAYLQAVQLAVEQSKKSSTDKARKAIPLSSYLQAGKLMVSSGRYREAFDYLMTGCQVYPSSSLFLLIGIASYRLDSLGEAEDALHEANLLESTNSDAWAYLSLVCLSSGNHRREEAEKAVYQAERLGVANSTLLRELATGFMAADKTQVAEGLIRRAVAVEISQSQTGRANPRTRQLLADILTVQNQAYLAVEEYQQVLADDTADLSTKLSAGERCASLLQAMGRLEELEVLKAAMRARQ